MALILAQELLITFTGKGLVPDSIVTLKSFSLAAAFGALGFFALNRWLVT